LLKLIKEQIILFTFST